MKTQRLYSTPTTLGPFLRLILALTAQHEVDTAENLQNPVAEAPGVSRAAVIDQKKAPEAADIVFTHAPTLGPFLTLLLTLQNRRSWLQRDWWQGPAIPRGAILAARYVSR
ncbi:MAG: hypothetical protein WCC92_20070 [Candidatus Korobacteraceae bacterium]